MKLAKFYLMTGMLMFSANMQEKENDALLKKIHHTPMASKADLINLLTNRHVFNKQYDYNIVCWVRYQSKDKLLLCMFIAIIIVLGYRAMQNSIAPLVSLLGIMGAFACLALFCYYAFRAHAYKTFMQQKEQLPLTYWTRVEKGKIRSIYIPSTHADKKEEMKLFLSNDTPSSQLVQWHMNTRERFLNRPNARRKFIDKTEREIADALYKAFDVQIIFDRSDFPENILLLDNMNISQTYSKYDEWKKLKIKNTDIAWTICRIIIVLCNVAIVVFLIALFTGMIG